MKGSITSIAVFLLIMLSSPSQGIIKPVVQEGHSGVVSSIVVINELNIFITASWDKTIKVWRLATRELVKTLRDHRGKVQTLAVDPSKRRLVSGDSMGTIKIWDLKSLELIRSIDGRDNVYAVAVHPRSSEILSGHFGGAIKVWDLPSGELKRTFGDASCYLRCLAIDPSGRYVVAGNENKKTKEIVACVWDYEKGSMIKKLKGHSKEGFFTGIDGVVIDREGTSVVTASLDGTIKIWSLKTGWLKKTLEGHEKGVHSLALDSENRFLVSGGRDGMIKIWDFKKRTLLKSFEGHSQNVNVVTIDADDRFIFSGGADNTVRIWDAATGGNLAILKEYPFDVNTLAISEKFKCLASGSEDGYVRTWDLASGKLLRTFKAYPEDLFKKKNLAPTIRSITLDGAGTIMAVGSFGRVQLWDLESGDFIRSIDTETGFINNMAMDPKGRFIAVPYGDFIRIIETDTGRVKTTLKGHRNSVYPVVMDPLGRYLVSGSFDTTVRIWDIEKGLLVNTLEGHKSDVERIVIDPSGEYIVSSSLDRTIRVWRLATGELLRTYSIEPAYVAALAVDRQGERIIAADTENTITVYKFKTTERVLTMKGHFDGVAALAVDPNNRYLLSGSRDNTVRIWQLDSGRPLVMLFAFEDASLVMTPEGFFDGTGNYGRHVRYVDDAFTLYGFDQFSRRFFRPESVQVALSGNTVTDSVTISKLINSRPAPSIEILAPAAGSVVESDMVDLKLKIHDRGGGIGDVYIYVNETLISNDARAVRINAAGPEHILGFRVMLLPGSNIIKAVVYNKDNTMASSRASVSLSASYETAPSNLYILAVGIDAYENEDLNLKYAVADSDLFVRIVADSSRTLFNKVKAITLRDKASTTKQSIVGAFQMLSQEIRASDYFIFYNSSHGYVAPLEDGDSKYFLITANVVFIDPVNLLRDALSQDELVKLIGGIQAQNKIIVLDTCHAGDVGKLIQVSMSGLEKVYTRALSVGTAMQLLRMASGSSVFTASQKMEEAVEGFKGHGLFTYTLTEGLRGNADGNKDSFVTLSELKAYVEKTVFQRSRLHFRRKQVPYVNIGSLDFSLVRVPGELAGEDRGK